MNDAPDKPPVNIDEMLSSSMDAVREGIRLRHLECKAHIREFPTASVVGAVGVGYLLHRLPVGALLITHVRVISALAPTALLIFGAAKFLGFLQRQEKVNRH